MKMKPIGSEKLTGMEKIQRIIEIANYGTQKTNVNESTTEYSKIAVDGNTYAIVKEKDGYYVKVGLNESTLDYVDGILNKNRYRFDSYSGALRKINLMIKPLNEQFNEGKEDPVLNEKKYVLRKPEAPVAEPEMEMPAAEPEVSAEPSMDVDLGMGDEAPTAEPEMDMEMGDELPSEEPEMEMGDEAPSEEDGDSKLKKVQKLTGKLGQALREMKIDLESSDIKYVLNSIISAVDLTKLNEEDLDDVMTNFEELDNFEIEGGEPVSDDDDAEMDFNFDDEDMEMDSEEAPEEEMNEISFSDSLEDEDDYRPMSDREDKFSDSLEDDLNEEGDMDVYTDELDENAFVKGLASLGKNFVSYYKNNPAAREVVNTVASKAIDKGTTKLGDRLDQSDSMDKSGNIAKSLKGFKPESGDIDKLGTLIFGDLNEEEVSKKIDDVLGKYFM